MSPATQPDTSTVVLLAILLSIAIATAYVVFASCRGDIVYMDHNGTTPFDSDSLRKYVKVAKELFGNPSTLCVAGNKAKDELERSRMTISSELGAKQTEIIFTSGATESNVIILRGFVDRAKKQGKPCLIVTTPIEHASVDNTVNSLASFSGVRVVKVKVDKFGFVNHADLFNQVGRAPPGTHILVSVIWVNNEIGTIQDISSIVRVSREGARDCHVHVHVDATQTVGRYLLDLGRLDVDSASFSAHKFYSAHGVGGLYLRRQCELATPMTGGKQEKGIRGGTENVAGVAAMAVALRKANARLRSGFQDHIKSMRDFLLQELVTAIPEIVVISPPERCAYNTLTACLPCDSRELVTHLSKKHNICIAVGSACSKGGVSKTLKAVGVPEEKISGSIRISLGLGNEMWQCHKVLKEIVAYVDNFKRLDDQKSESNEV